MHSRPLKPTPARIAAALLLAAAVLLAQMLGLAHGVLHADRHADLHAGRHAAAMVHDLAHPAAPGHDLGEHDLFGTHDDESQCRLYDQLAHGDLAVSAAPLALSACPPTLAVAHHPTWHLAAQAAGFLARAPPARG